MYFVSTPISFRSYSDLDKFFPSLTLHFDGADMKLGPSGYLFLQSFVSSLNFLHYSDVNALDFVVFEQLRMFYQFFPSLKPPLRPVHRVCIADVLQCVVLIGGF